MTRLLTALFVCVALVGNGQTWLDFGIKGGYGPSIVINSNFFGDNEFNQRLIGSYTVGGKIGLNFGNKSELTFDVMHSRSNYLFNYNVLDEHTGASPLYQKKLSLKSLDFLVLYRMHGERGNYLEIGPQFSVIRDAEGSTTYPENHDGVIEDNISKNYMAMTLGFGQYLIGNEKISVTLGARFSYGITDLVSSTGRQIQYPAPNKYDTYAASHAFSAMAMLELNYDLGYLSKACTKRMKLILF